MTAPIFIPTKGRALTAKTPRLLREAGLDFCLVVEPQELGSYEESFPAEKHLVLDENDAGIVFVRNAILEYARKQGIEWFWMLDDDISSFYKVQAWRCVKENAREVLDMAESYIKSDREVALGALEYQQIAWAAKKAYTDNSYAEVAVLINPRRIAHSYDPSMALKEDRDFAMQTILSGFKTRRVNILAFGVPMMGKNPGGLQEKYQERRDEIAAKALIQKWGSTTCRLNNKKDGRIDVKIFWRKIKAGDKA